MTLTQNWCVEQPGPSGCNKEHTLLFTLNTYTKDFLIITEIEGKVGYPPPPHPHTLGSWKDLKDVNVKQRSSL